MCAVTLDEPFARSRVSTNGSYLESQAAKMIQDLSEILSAVGKSPEAVESEDGSRILVLPYGGRVIGLFPPNSGRNFLWTHPALESPESARVFYDAPSWHNSGGDRTWIAPEIDFFFPQYPDLNAYWQPRQIDPGRYAVRRDGESVSLANQLHLVIARSKRSVVLQITKSVSAALNPLRYEPCMKLIEGVKYAGYTLNSSLEYITGETESFSRVGLWNLLQMPLGGEMLVTTHFAVQPTAYMGAPSPDRLTVGEHLTRYKMSAPGVEKVGFRAATATGRVGYLYPTGDDCALVVRNFSVNPSGEYIDTPKLDPTRTGDAFQACSVDNAVGSFSELEHHVPAIGDGTGRTRCNDASQVWAYRGAHAEIKIIARNLLSPEIS